MRSQNQSWLRAMVFGLMTATAACGGEAVTARSGPQKGDEVVAQTVWVRPVATHLQCVVAPCPAFLMRGINGAPSHEVTGVDLSALDLPEGQAEELWPSLEALLLLQGRYHLDGQDGQAVIFVVSRALSAVASPQAEDPARDRYYNVRVGSACPDDRCLGFVAQPLGQSGEEQWTHIDLQALQLAPETEQALWLEMRSSGMVLSVRPGNGNDGAVTATQAFRPLQATY